MGAGEAGGEHRAPLPDGGSLLHSSFELLEGLVADTGRQVIKEPSAYNAGTFNAQCKLEIISTLD